MTFVFYLALLVLMVIGAFVVLPLLRYSVTVMRAPCGAAGIGRARRVRTAGGVAAVPIDVERAGDSSIGLDNPTTQKTLMLTTSVAGEATTATATVQVNDNFRWALNAWQVR